MPESNVGSNARIRESLLAFEEGLIGFPDFKTFRLIESDSYEPFCRLESPEDPRIGFFVLDPLVVFQDYESSVPCHEWDALEIHAGKAKQILTICVIGATIRESTCNLQAPILVNRGKLTGRQIILSDARFESRHPIFKNLTR